MARTEQADCSMDLLHKQLINSRKIRRQVLSPEQQAARIRARARMDEGWPIGAGRLDRDSLHERSADRES